MRKSFPGEVEEKPSCRHQGRCSGPWDGRWRLEGALDTSTLAGSQLCTGWAVGVRTLVLGPAEEVVVVRQRVG